MDGKDAPLSRAAEQSSLGKLKVRAPSLTLLCAQAHTVVLRFTASGACAILLLEVFQASADGAQAHASEFLTAAPEQHKQ